MSLPAKPLLIWLILLTIQSSTIKASSVNLTNGEWPPYLGKDLPYHGFASHIVTQAFAAVGIKVSYSFLPWQRAYHYAHTGKGLNQTWHGTLVWVYTPARAKLFYYSQPVVIDEAVLFHLKTTPLHNWKSFNDLQGKIIGGTQHTAYPVLESAQQKGILHLERAGNYFDLFNRLLGKRIDAVPQVRQVGEYYLRTQFSKQQRSLITSAPNIFQTRKYFLIINKKTEENKQLIKKFNHGLSVIKQNGTYSLMYKQLTSGFYDTQSVSEQY